jgi:pantetheine-phosphate adenylyltransferase
MQDLFDPITNGHIDIISRSLKFCDKLIIGVGINPGKTPFFSVKERLQLIAKFLVSEFGNPDKLSYMPTTVSAISFDNLLTDFAREMKAKVLIRGIRSVSDFEYEINLAGINKMLAPEIETIFIPTDPTLATISSSMVKEICKFGGDISQFVPDYVAQACILKNEGNQPLFLK